MKDIIESGESWQGDGDGDEEEHWVEASGHIVLECGACGEPLFLLGREGDGNPRPPHRRSGLHHQVTTEEQHPARKPRRLARIAHHSRLAKLAPHKPHFYGRRPVALPPSPPGGSLSSSTPELPA